MDIQRLLRTYIHVNDEKRRNVTIKLVVFALALAVFAGVLYTQATSGPAPTQPDPAAETGGDGDEGDTLTRCLTKGGWSHWQVDNPDAVVHKVEHVEGDRVCVTYTP